MFKKSIIVSVFLTLMINNAVFSQAVSIDTALANATRDFAEGVPNESKIAILNITSDSINLSDYIINELIVNLVNTRQFQIVPRSAVELAAARREFAFQMSGDVSDDSQKNVGQFLEADTIITGSVTRDSANTYRLIINAIHLENFTFQSSFRASIQNDRQIRTLIADSGGVFYEDYTTGQRLGMGALNMFFGIGSIANGHHIGWITTVLELGGLGLMIPGIFELNYGYREDYDPSVRGGRAAIAGGVSIIGAGVLFGYIIPFFHHKPNNTNVTQNTFPFGLELVSSNYQDINGFKLVYNMKF